MLGSRTAGVGSMTGQPPGPALVPTQSGAWKPRVSYRVIEEAHDINAQDSPEEPEIPSDKEELIRFCQHQDHQIHELKMQAKQMRAKQHGDHDDWAKRIADLEAHVLSSKLKPVAHGADAAPPPPPIPSDLVPNGLLTEFRDRVPGESFREQMNLTPWEEDRMYRQMDMNMESMRLGLPSIQQLGLPEGSKIIDIRLVEGNIIRQLMKAEAQERARMSMNPQLQQAQMPPPTLTGRIYDGNHCLTPSPLHPVGPAAQMGLLQNVYPIDRCPISYENVMQTTWPGAQEQWYTAYGDYFQGRKFPATFPETKVERDVDRGKNVRNTMWRTTPSGDHMAAIGLDVNGDGWADVTVVGKDKNFDGVPDILQVNPLLRMSQNVCSRIFPH